MSFQFKNRLKINGMVSKMSEKKNLSLQEKEQLGEAVLMKKVKEYRGKKGESEAVVWRCSIKKLFLEILQNSPENTCARALFG